MRDSYRLVSNKNKVNNHQMLITKIIYIIYYCEQLAIIFFEEQENPEY